MGEWMHLGWPEPGGGWIAWVKKIKSVRKLALPFRCKISYRFIVGKFEIAGKVDKREQKKK